MNSALAHPLLSYSLVSLQFASIAALLGMGAWLASSFFGLLLQGLGVFVGLWAVKTMHLGRFNIVPDPRADGELVETGPYRWVRHPMYLSILLVMSPMVVADTSVERFVWLLVLVATLLIKLHYEESLLRQHFADYATYQQRSHKLLPGVF